MTVSKKGLDHLLHLTSQRLKKASALIYVCNAPDTVAGPETMGGPGVSPSADVSTGPPHQARAGSRGQGWPSVALWISHGSDVTRSALEKHGKYRDNVKIIIVSSKNKVSMMESSQILFTFTVCCLLTQSISGLHVNPSGGYSDVLVKIEDGVDGCDVVVENLKKFLSSSSDALDSALSGEKSQINFKGFSH